MPRQIDALPEPRQDSLPWATLLNGEKWDLVRGEDYSDDEMRIVGRAKSAARRYGVKVRTRISRAKGTVSVQAVALDGSPLRTPCVPAASNG